MDYKQFNEKFKDLETFRRTNRSALVEKITEYEIDNSYGEGEQGAVGIFHEIYPWDGEVFLKLTFNTDSYGDNEFVNGIQFVKPVQKMVSSFESVG